MVQVETGDTNDFDPINDVYIVLYGDHGDSGPRYLSKNKEAGLLFELFKVSCTPSYVVRRQPLLPDTFCCFF